MYSEILRMPNHEDQGTELTGEGEAALPEVSG